jgi:hypothetical protein
MNCPSCGGELSPSHRFCPSCGAPVSSLSQAPTAGAESPAAAAAAAFPSPVGRLISSDSLPVGGFTPGMVLADRYRIIGLIGRGGMGEVYRADDLKLGQPVALKFLPKSLADDPVRRERLFAEVRIARQVSHPNICRVYDITEIEGRHFLTMEYIDGEDLASLLKRIGNLPGTKALDVARQLCAGLAAAHDKGVLHRDLKPANVMIDGRGRVRITDFGLAVAEGEEIHEADVSGTPPYMAPEQFAGKGASVRSDIYALGLVFYEIFTGKRAFEAKTLAELRAKKEASLPTAPSEIARDMDPIVERVIMRCIEKDPRQRPASAAQVAAALPGGDPLAAAIAAGETPSPEMVAAAGGTGGIRPWIAWICLVFIILGIGASIYLRRNSTYRRVSIDKPPDVMAEKARDILKSVGYPDPPGDSVYRYTDNQTFLQDMMRYNKLPKGHAKLPALAVQFWYRQSPESLSHSPFSNNLTPMDPPLVNKGESVVWLDSAGNLTGLQVIPGNSKPSGIALSPDWSILFKAAGLDPVQFTSVEPDWTYSAYSDTRKAWKGSLPDCPELPIQIEAAGWQGKPIYWRLIVPSEEKPLNPKQTSSARKTIRDVAALLGIIVTVGGLAFFARKNLRMGRGDRRGAIRLACFLFIINGIVFFCTDHFGSVTDWLVDAGLIWLMYIALEPYVRRRWSNMLIGWNRLLAGDLRDPFVGRELLFGCAAGIVLFCTPFSVSFLSSCIGGPSSMGIPAAGPTAGSIETLYLLSGARAFVVGVLQLISALISSSFNVALTLFLMRVLLRRTWAAVIVCIVLFSASMSLPQSPYTSYYTLQPLIIVLSCCIHYWMLLRFGILALIAETLFFNSLMFFPITTQPTWYSGIGYAGLILLLALPLFAFYTSFGGQPLFGRTSLED